MQIRFTLSSLTAVLIGVLLIPGLAAAESLDVLFTARVGATSSSIETGSVDMGDEEMQDIGHPLLRDWQSEMELADDDLSQITEIE